MNDSTSLVKARKDAKVCVGFLSLLPIIVIGNGFYMFSGHATPLKVAIFLVATVLYAAVFIRPYVNARKSVNRLTQQA